MVLNVNGCIQENRVGGKLCIVPNWVVNELIDKVHVATILETGEVLYYQNGRYIGNGYQYISQLLAREFGNEMSDKGKPLWNKNVKNEIFDTLKDRTFIKLDEFDTNKDIINMKNCLYNWRTGESSPHTPMYYSRIQVPIEYNKDATCEKIEEILHDIIQPQDYIKVLEFISYIFYRGYDIQKAFILYGPGGTGKSAFLNMIIHLIGSENCSAVPFGEIDRLFSRATLCHKMLNQCGELDSASVKRTDIFKDVTSGLEQIQAEFKYGQPFWFVNVAKMLWATNTLPKVFDETDGFYRRIEVILFLRKFNPEDYDQARMDAMVDPSQLSGLFNLCIKYLAPLIDRHDFTNASNIEDIREMYRSASDPLETFVDTHIVSNPEGRATCNEIYDLYCEHCIKYKVKPPSIHKFNNKFAPSVKGMRMGNILFNGKKKINVWEGIEVV